MMVFSSVNLGNKGTFDSVINDLILFGKRIINHLYLLYNDMIEYLSEEEVEKINELSLINGEQFNNNRPDDVRSALNFVQENFEEDIYKKATAYCVTLIILHAFQQGNHRTSIHCAQFFLEKNNFTDYSTNKSFNDLQEWRVEQEYKNNEDLIRGFYRITSIEDNEERALEVLNIIKSEYGLKIEEWLKNNYKKG